MEKLQTLLDLAGILIGIGAGAYAGLWVMHYRRRSLGSDAARPGNPKSSTTRGNYKEQTHEHKQD
jgi:hypothetical protein